MDARVTSAFTRVVDALYPRMTVVLFDIVNRKCGQAHASAGPIWRARMNGRWRGRSRPATAAASFPPRGDDRFQESRQIIGDVIDMRRIPSLELPALAKDFAGVLGDHQHRG